MDEVKTVTEVEFFCTPNIVPEYLNKENRVTNIRRLEEGSIPKVGDLIDMNPFIEEAGRYCAIYSNIVTGRQWLWREDHFVLRIHVGEKK